MEIFYFSTQSNKLNVFEIEMSLMLTNAICIWSKIQQNINIVKYYYRSPDLSSSFWLGLAKLLAHPSPQTPLLYTVVSGVTSLSKFAHPSNHIWEVR